jgi:hypothetical protein
MDIHELGKRRFKLERDITAKLNELIKKFSEETGLTPSDIRINMSDAAKVSDQYHQWMVTRVEVDIKI